MHVCGHSKQKTGKKEQWRHRTLYSFACGQEIVSVKIILLALLHRPKLLTPVYLKHKAGASAGQPLLKEY